MTLEDAMRVNAATPLSSLPDAYAALLVYLSANPPVVTDKLGGRASIRGTELYRAVRLLQGTVRAIREYGAR